MKLHTFVTVQLVAKNMQWNEKIILIVRVIVLFSSVLASKGITVSLWVDTLLTII